MFQHVTVQIKKLHFGFLLSHSVSCQNLEWTTEFVLSYNDTVFICFIFLSFTEKEELHWSHHLGYLSTWLCTALYSLYLCLFCTQ